MRAEERWGAGVVKQFALDMRQAFPNETGFSDTNVKYMKRWYSFYFERVTKGQQVADQMKGDKKGHQLGDDKTIVEWSLQDIQKPLGVATYQLQEVVDRTVTELELKKKLKEEDEK